MSITEMFAWLTSEQGLMALLAQNWVLGTCIIAAIVFIETGLVVMPFLPGDSLLFIAGALGATGSLDPVLLGALLIVAAITGNSVNYAVGRYIGPRVFSMNLRFLDRGALMRTHAFYEKHGGKTIVMSRFIPVVRTFAPFVAGVADMPLSRFQLFNILGALLWVVGLWRRAISSATFRWSRST